MVLVLAAGLSTTYGGVWVGVHFISLKCLLGRRFPKFRYTVSDGRLVCNIRLGSLEDFVALKKIAGSLKKIAGSKVEGEMWS